MKKNILKINKRELITVSLGIFIGALLTYTFTHVSITYQKKLTSRILQNAVISMETSKSLAESCSEAYNKATVCVSNLSTCNIQEETRKLDLYNSKRKTADREIKRINIDMGKIIEEVKKGR